MGRTPVNERTGDVDEQNVLGEELEAAVANSIVNSDIPEEYQWDASDEYVSTNVEEWVSPLTQRRVAEVLSLTDAWEEFRRTAALRAA